MKLTYVVGTCRVPSWAETHISALSARAETEVWLGTSRAEKPWAEPWGSLRIDDNLKTKY